jgi:hypothetical protein
MSSIQSPPNPTKPRIQRLRASCDGCFAAKVKCSKSRPICSRCLACGTDCKYSPSSRAGKPPRAESRRPSQSSLQSGLPKADPKLDDTVNSTFIYSRSLSAGQEGENSPAFTVDTNWPTPSGSTDAGRQSLSSNTTPSLGSETLIEGDVLPIHHTNEALALPLHPAGELFEQNLSWIPTSHPDIDMKYRSPSQGGILMPSSNSITNIPHSPLAPWLESNNNTTITGFTQEVGSDFTDFMSSPPSFFSDQPMQKFDLVSRSGTGTGTGNCNCFTTCLQALQALHNHAGPAQVAPPFDVVLTVNGKAVEGCATMLACSNCVSKSGSHTTAMLLATIIEKIMSFYREASQNHFGFTRDSQRRQSVPLTFGTYTIASEDGRWLEMEILWRELRKLEELFIKFKEICSQGVMSVMDEGEDASVQTALMTHLSQSLKFTFEVLKAQNNSLGSRNLDARI